MDTTDDVPVFDKRLFVTRGSVVLTRAAREVMQRNARALSDNLKLTLTRSDIYAMRCVVEGLKLMHRDSDSVKDILSHVLTLEQYAANQQVGEHKAQMEGSCFYIVSGSVRATYGHSDTATPRTVHQPGIVYSHGAGEYLGMVSAEGPQGDLSTPVTVYTEEATQLLRVDRDQFHALMAAYNRQLEDDKQQFLSDPRCLLSTMTQAAAERILPHVSKLELPANREVIQQGAVSDHVYFVASGRCQLTRSLLLPNSRQKVTCCLGYREPYSFFAEECIVAASPSNASPCTATTTAHTVLIRLHRTAHDVVCKDQLYNVLLRHSNQYPSDEDLQLRGQLADCWTKYRCHQVTAVVGNAGSDRKRRHQAGVNHAIF